MVIDIVRPTSITITQLRELEEDEEDVDEEEDDGDKVNVIAIKGNGLNLSPKQI